MTSTSLGNKLRKKNTKTFSFLLLTLTAGCAVGPTYKRPEAATPSAFKERVTWQEATPSDDSPRGAWWEVYNDPVLNQLEDQVATSNQSLKALASNYEQSRQLARSDFTTLLPSAGIAGSSTHSRAAESKTATNSISSISNASLTASWTPDFWGKIRQQGESDVASAQVIAANYANARLSTEATLAADYIDLRILDEKKRLIDISIDNYSKTLKISQNKYAVGVAARRDVISSQAQLDSARAQSIDVGVQRAQLEHAIAVLVGKNPEELSIPVKPTLDLNTPKTPLIVPAKLLERRPDIAAAERLMAEQNAKIGIQTAAFFPSITLSGSSGFQGTPLSQLITSPFKVWSLGASATDTLLDFGQKYDQYAASKAAYESSVATYRQTVLSAFQQIEDQLSSLRILDQEAVIQSEAVKEASEASRIAQNEYAAGTVDFTTVAAAEVSELSNRESYLTILQNQLKASVTLIEGLGGGWNTTLLPSTSQVIFSKKIENKN